MKGRSRSWTHICYAFAGLAIIATAAITATAVTEVRAEPGETEVECTCWGEGTKQCGVADCEGFNGAAGEYDCEPGHNGQCDGEGTYGTATCDCTNQETGEVTTEDAADCIALYQDWCTEH